MEHFWNFKGNFDYNYLPFLIHFTLYHSWPNNPIDQIQMICIRMSNAVTVLRLCHNFSDKFALQTENVEW